MYQSDVQRNAIDRYLTHCQSNRSIQINCVLCIIVFNYINYLNNFIFLSLKTDHTDIIPYFLIVDITFKAHLTCTFVQYRILLMFNIEN